MPRTRITSFARAAAGVLLFVAWAGCSGEVDANGACTVDPMITCDGQGFVGYSCTGTVRPDEIQNVNHVVQGVVCHDVGSQSSGAAGFCCTPQVTECAFDPTIVCMDGTSGYSCMGTNRPDSFDPALTCTQGLRAGGVISFCCGNIDPGACGRNANFPCMTGTLNFRCAGSKLPTQGDLGVDQSRSETPLLCNLPTPDAISGSDFCCFAAAETPTGASCLQDQKVTGCQPGDFGFACTGTDTPDQDYPRMSCPSPGVRGVSAQGYPALLYCCSFQQR